MGPLTFCQTLDCLASRERGFAYHPDWEVEETAIVLSCYRAIVIEVEDVADTPAREPMVAEWEWAWRDPKGKIKINK